MSGPFGPIICDIGLFGMFLVRSCL